MPLAQTPAGTGQDGGTATTPPPTTLDGWTTLVDADRTAISTLQDQSVQHIQDLNDTLRSDTAAYRSAVQELNKASRRKSSDDRTATRIGLSNQVQLLKMAINADRTSIITYHKTFPATLAAARQKLASDLKDMRQAQHDAAKAS